ncbi:MAG: DUF721 domain-containing protein [Longimicrobiales bacterium]|nr:DUF721 domain-containing protein [Longimicrobiales bacterium]
MRPRSGGRQAAPVRVGEVLAEFLEREGVADEVARASAVEAWPERVGPGIARVTRARSISGGALVVEVASSAWLMELNLMKGEILRRVNEGRDVPVEKLVFVMSPDG